MQTRIFFFTLILFINGCIDVTTGRQKVNTGQEIFFADPTIFVENGIYYLSGTKTSKPMGFALLQSTNLKDWIYPESLVSKSGMVLTIHEDVYGEQGFWAPQFLKVDNKYYLTYTASSQTAIAFSQNLTGPYVQESIQPIDASAKNIDSFIFKDDDGKYYLYHVRFNKGNYIWVAEFDMNTKKIHPETLQQCLENTEPWEKTASYESAPIMEGPTVIKMKGVYYLFYSANHFISIDYAVGYATSKSPFGPWTKYAGNPIIHRSIVHEKGAGHGDFFFDNAQNPYYVYHVHYSDSVVSPRKTRIVPLKMKLNNNTGIYDISVLPNNIIIPVVK